MTESAITFTRSELDRLQRLRASLLAFQNAIASLPADEQSNAHNEQFNQLHLEAKTLLKDRGFDKKVTRAITEDMLAHRSQRVILPRLSGIVILGVILALVGLGVNSIILEDPIINGLGCCVSSGGMLLILGAFGVFGLTNYRRNLTNFGALYQRCNTLLYEIDHTLNMAIPNLADRPQVDIPEIPSVVELALDSLNKQAADWQQKLQTLEEERLTLGPDAPMELTINIDFAQQELNRVKQEIDRLNGRITLALDLADTTDTDSEEVITPAAREIASANTLDMPVVKTEEEAVDSEEKADSAKTEEADRG